MNSDLKKFTLGEACNILTGFPFKGENYSTVGVRVLRGENVTVGNLRWDTIKCWSLAFNENNKYSLQEGDIVIGMDGSRVGKNRAQIRKEDLPLLLAQRVARLRANGNFSQDFLFYVIRSDNFESYINGIKTGTSIPHISAQQIKEFVFYAPNKETQIRIANILRSIDDKIELNRQTNVTLEAIAQAIFKEWFVDFNYPGATGEMVDSELGPIPKGWSVKPLDEIANFLNGLALQKYPPKNVEDYLPVIKIREMRNGVTESSDRATRNLPKEYIIHDGDLLFSWSGSLEVQFWVGGEGALNQHLFKVTSENYPLWFCYHWILYHLTDFRNIAEEKTTTMGHIKREHINQALCLIPNHFEALSHVMGPIANKKIQNSIEICLLSKLRDHLLLEIMNRDTEIFK